MQQVFLGLLLNDVEHVVDRDHAHEAVLQVDDRDREQVVLRDQLRDFFRAGVDLRSHDALDHDVLELERGVGEDEAAQREHSHQMLVGVDAVDVEERLLTRVLTDGLDGLGDGELLVEREELGVHQRAGGLFLALQQRLELGALRGAQDLQDPSAAVFVEDVEKVGGVVRGRRAADRGQRGVVGRVEDLVEVALVELEQGTRRLAGLDEQGEDPLAVFLQKQGQHRRDIRREGLVDDLAELRIRPVPQQLGQELLIRPRLRRRGRMLLRCARSQLACIVMDNVAREKVVGPCDPSCGSRRASSTRV